MEMGEKEQTPSQPDEAKAEDTEDTEGNIYLPRGGAKPNDGGENPTGSDESGAEGGESFHPRGGGFHPRP
jgi:hypothetical protein